MSISDFICIYGDGEMADIDAQENHIAFICNMCEYPVLGTLGKHQGKYLANNPARCRNCDEKYVVEIRERMKKIVIYNLADIS